MQRNTVVLIGATGMLGGMLLDVLAAEPSIRLIATVRDHTEAMHALAPQVQWRALDAESAGPAACAEAISGANWIINAVGIIKPFIHDDHPAEVQRAIRVNAMFPHSLAEAASGAGARMLQIATDCVYSGAKGMYTERDPHDPHDVYGKTKSLGEVYGSHVGHLRCSIIGPELRSYRSLMEWFRRQPRGAHLTGYVNHKWNGITTLHFSRICMGIIKGDVSLPHVQHVVPSDTITKAALLEVFRTATGREDITITPADAPEAVDRTLGTLNPEYNRALWAGAGYSAPPAIDEMVRELTDYDRGTTRILREES